MLVATSGRHARTATNARIADTPMPPCCTIHGIRAYFGNPTQITLLGMPVPAESLHRKTVHNGGSARGLPEQTHCAARRALEEVGSRIGAAASRGAVIELEQGRISCSWQPDATTSRWRPRA